MIKAPVVRIGLRRAVRRLAIGDAPLCVKVTATLTHSDHPYHRSRKETRSVYRFLGGLKDLHVIAFGHDREPKTDTHTSFDVEASTTGRARSRHQRVRVCASSRCWRIVRFRSDREATAKTAVNRQFLH